MKKKLLVLSTGFALFSMFFGSGNLVFPLLVGKESGAHFFMASLGIILTGVVVPFLGALGIMLYNGSFGEFFKSLGKVGTFCFSLTALSLMGPFGVAARCLTVAHGAFQMLVPSATLTITSLALCVLIYFMTINKKKVIPILGTVLTPLLLAAIIAIVFFALKGSNAGTLPLAVSHDVSAWFAFKNAFLQGYQMMDLLAAFFFSAFVIEHLNSVKAQNSSKKSSLKVFMQAACLGGGILGFVYCVLVVLGSLYSTSLIGLLPQQMLGHIAMLTLGSLGAPVLCVVVLLACSTTAIILVSLFSDFLHKEILKEKMHSRYSLMITLAITFIVSTLGFTGISQILGPIIEIIYPALIMLTAVNIAHKFLGTTNSHWPVTLTLAAKIGLLRFI